LCFLRPKITKKGVDFGGRVDRGANSYLEGEPIVFTKRVTISLAAWGLVLALAFFSACAAPKVAAPTPGEGVGTAIVLPTATPLGEEVEPIPGGVYRGYFSSDPPYWDPNMGTNETTHIVLNRAHATLLQFHYGTKYPTWNFDISRDSLAQSWETSADGLTYTFHLRQGVRWQNKPPMNGREFVAEDVKWTLERHMGQAGAPRRDRLLLYIESIKCPDKYTVVIKLKEPWTDLILVLATPSVEMLPREAAEEFGDLNTWKAVIGVGPFVLEEYVPNVRITYKKNPTYYRANEGLPYLDGMRYVLIGDASTSLAAFRAEKIDVRTISRIDLASVKKTNPNVYCYEAEVALSDWAIAFRTDKTPFSDVNLRRAVSMAIDRKAVIDSSYFGYGIEQVGPIHVMSPWYLADPAKDPTAWGECLKYEQYNPEEARRLIAAAGYPGGLTVTLTTFTGTEAAELVADFLDKVGIKVTMKPLEVGAGMSIMYQRHSYDDLAYLQKWAATTLAPDSWVVAFYRKGYASNYSNVDDPVLELMVAAQNAELNPQKRQEMLNEIQRYEICQKYYVHWPHSYGVTCMQPWLRGYARHAVYSHSGRIEELIWLTEDAPGRKI